MKFVDVESSNVKKLCFEEDYRISMNSEPMTRLRVVFWNEIAWDYYRVPKEVYEDLINAESTGGFFHKYIKTRYSSEKVPE